MDLPLTALGLGAVLVFSALFSTAEALLNKITKGEVKETIEEGGSRAEAITALLQNLPVTLSVMIPLSFSSTSGNRVMYRSFPSPAVQVLAPFSST